MNILFNVPSSYKRDGFLDILKGFAILLMVIGHVITWLYNPSVSSTPFKNHIWWNVIYSFHMPLLFFVSGYLFPKSDRINWRSALTGIKKRMISLLIPFVFGGILYHIFRGSEWTVFWFLLALFNFTIINTFWEVVRTRGKYQILADIVFYLIFYAMMVFVPKGITNVLELRPVHYLVFCLGIIIRRYRYEKFLDNRHVFSVSFLLFVIINYLTINGIKIPQSFILTSVTGIATSWYLFKRLDVQSLLYRFLKCLGYYSLELYISHGFFVIKLFAIGAFITSITGFGDDMMTRSTIELVVAAAITMIVLSLCMILIKVTKESYIFNFLFGKQND